LILETDQEDKHKEELIKLKENARAVNVKVDLLIKLIEVIDLLKCLTLNIVGKDTNQLATTGLPTCIEILWHLN
tara:strand:+ start:102 stop:323 length:222 start_codon:yes stop_codon:yes gene_type:complete